MNGNKPMLLDACAIIYLLEGSDEKSDKVRQLVTDYLAAGKSPVFVSSLSILECLVIPKKQANTRLIAEYEAFFAANHVQVIDVKRDIVYLAVDLRAKYNLRTPDALQLACALKQQVKFITGDKGLLKVEAVNVVIL
jgi:predicted nucleic acid-binding protein